MLLSRPGLRIAHFFPTLDMWTIWTFNTTEPVREGFNKGAFFLTFDELNQATVFGLPFHSFFASDSAYSANVWHAGPIDRSLDSGSGGFSRRDSTPGLGTKNIYGICLPPSLRRFEVDGAEPEIWPSPNQKRRITIRNAERRKPPQFFKKNRTMVQISVAYIGKRRVEK